MSDANRTALRYTREQSFNVVVPTLTAVAVQGTNTLYNLRFVKDTLEHGKDTVQSDEIQATRIVQDLVQVGVKAVGAIDGELPLREYDDLIACSLQADDFLAVSVAGTIAGQTITADAGTPFGPLIGAKFLRLANCATAANNGIKVVVSITATVITLAAGSLTGSDSADTIDYYTNYVTAIDAVTVTVAAQVITATTGTFSLATRGARYVKLANMATAGNNGIKKVVSCTATVLTLAAGSLSGSDTLDVCTVQCCYMRTGTTYQSLMFQKEYLDILSYIVYTGMTIDTLELKMSAKAKVMTTFSFMGYQGQPRTATANTAAAIASSTNPVVNTSSNIGAVTKDGTTMANPVKTLNLKLGNGIRERPQIGSLGTAQHGDGYSTITGTIEVYFSNPELLTAFMNHTAFALEYKIIDSLGNIMNIFMPKIQSPKGTPQDGGVNTDVMQSVDFQALPDPTLGYQLQIDLLNA